MPHLKRTFLALAAFVALGFAAAPARADIVIVSGNNPQTDENVLLNTGVTGNPIFGTTNQTQTQVRFMGSELLAAPANGQARVEAASGLFGNLAIDLPGSTFTSLILNINAAQAGTVNFVVTEPNMQTTLGSFALGAGGQNFFTITAINNQRILSVAFSTTVNGVATDIIQDVRQVRIGGVQTTTAPVPEPTTMLLLGTGLAGVGAAVRRRRKNDGAQS